MTGKEIYERRKRLKAERMMREEERRALHDIERDEDAMLVASLAASLERIADALEKITEEDIRIET